MTQTDNQNSAARVNQDDSAGRTDKPALWLWSQYAFDSFAWIVAVFLAVILRLELLVTQINVPGAVVFCAVAVISQLVVGMSFAL